MYNARTFVSALVFSPLPSRYLTVRFPFFCLRKEKRRFSFPCLIGGCTLSLVLWWNPSRVRVATHSENRTSPVMKTNSNFIHTDTVGDDNRGMRDSARQKDKRKIDFCFKALRGSGCCQRFRSSCTCPNHRSFPPLPTSSHPAGLLFRLKTINTACPLPRLPPPSSPVRILSDTKENNRSFLLRFNTHVYISTTLRLLFHDEEDDVVFPLEVRAYNRRSLPCTASSPSTHRASVPFQQERQRDRGRVHGDVLLELEHVHRGQHPP